MEGTHSIIVRTSFDGNEKNPRSYTLDNTAWNGTECAGKAVADGVIYRVIRYTPMVPGAEEQSTNFMSGSSAYQNQHRF